MRRFGSLKLTRALESSRSAALSGLLLEIQELGCMPHKKGKPV
jgi:hypothetical protein